MDKVNTKAETLEKKAEEGNFSRASRNVMLTLTLATALYFVGCQQKGEDWNDGNQKEMKADSVVYRGGHATYYYGGRPFVEGTTNSSGQTFRPSKSGNGGYFVSPKTTVPRGGFGTKGYSTRS